MQSSNLYREFKEGKRKKEEKEKCLEKNFLHEYF
jgi:hypothetical protein